MPVIILFTKYDRLVSEEIFLMAKAGLEIVVKKAEQIAKYRLHRECIAPLEALVGKTIPYVPVSSMSIIPHYITFAHSRVMHSTPSLSEYP